MMVTLEKLKIKPEYDRLVYRQDEQTYNELKRSIQENGQYHPIIVNNDGIVLDGHHRYRICQELKIEPKIEVKKFVSELHEKLFVVDTNLNRRHLSDWQRTKLALWAKPILEEIAKHNLRLSHGRGQKGSQISDDLKQIRVDEEVGKRAHVSRDTIRKAEVITEKASDELKEKLDQGKTTINAVFNEIKKTEAKKKILNETPRTQDNKRTLLLQGDFIEKTSFLKEGDIDLIFTDPPYERKDLRLYHQLGDLAQRVLKPGGSLVTYIGTYELPSILESILQSGLKYWWIFCVKHSGGHAHMMQRRVFVNWKPLLWFVKGNESREAFDSIDDFVQSSPPKKALHPWQQSTVEAEHIIQKLTIGEDQTVLDPFMGSGTTGIAAIKLKRKFIGIEKDAEIFEIAKREIANVL